MAMSAASLEVTGLSAGYGLVRIIEDITFSVPAGGRLAVLGRNGMGKTTLLATLAGQTRRHAGSIRLGGKEIAQMDGPTRALGGLGYVPQHRAIFKSLSVEENLFVGLKARPRSAIEDAYALFPRLRERRRNLGGQLSGGEQQMLSTARTILGQPDMLLLDEPLEGLAPVIREELMAAFGALAQSQAMTILLVEQRIEAALNFADSVLILQGGRTAWTGTPQDLAAQPETVDRLLGLRR
jgi:branched-chain amino acid transport system ATP-binding protein